MSLDETKIADLSEIAREGLKDLRGEVPFLVTVAGPEDRKEYEVSSSTILGRDENADIMLNSKLISRNHAIIEEIGGSYHLQDLNSTNGTFVNGDRVTGSVILKSGDIIHIGEVILKFVIRDPAESEYQRRIKDMATRDALTGIFNRGYFETEGDRLLGRLAGEGRCCSLIIFDIDHFKKINDTYGHPVGDFVLRSLAEILSHSLRKSDLFARYGGEEFVILLEGLPREAAGAMADRLRRKVEVFPFKTEDLELNVTISLGVASYPDDALSLADLVTAADQALYNAKRAGRNRCFLAGASPRRT